MLHELLVGLARGTAGLEVDDAALSRSELSGRVRASCPQVVVLRRDGTGLPGWATELFDLNPRLRFLSLDPEGRSGDLFDLRLAHRRIEEISADALIAAFQDALGAPWASPSRTAS